MVDKNSGSEDKPGEAHWLVKRDKLIKKKKKADLQSSGIKALKEAVSWHLCDQESSCSPQWICDTLGIAAGQVPPDCILRSSSNLERKDFSGRNSKLQNC